MQPRFEKRTGTTPFSLVEQPRFRAAFDFMRLRADIGEVDVVLADWWQEFSQASDLVREDLVAQLRDEQQKQHRKARRVPKAATPEGEGEQQAPREKPRREPARADGEAAPETAGDDGPASDAPRKRRRRRRKPSGQGAGGGGGDAQSPAGDRAE